MQYGVVIPANSQFADATAFADLVDAAEALGYHTAWFGDHIVIPSYAARLSSPQWIEPLAACLFGAGRTTRLRFGTDVLVLPYRNPVWLSQLVASADVLCGGRLTLGVGVGYIKGEFAALNTPPYEKRGAATDEYLEVLRTLWEASGPASYHGEFVQFDDVIAGPPPAQAPFPILVGGNHARARRRAATYGSGWHPLFPTPEGYAAGRTDIERRRAELGKTGPFTYSYSTATTRVILSDADWPGPINYAELGDIPDEYHYAPPLPTADGERPYFLGNPDQIRADVAAFEAAGVEHLTLRFWAIDATTTPADVIEQMRRFAELVAR